MHDLKELFYVLCLNSIVLVLIYTMSLVIFIPKSSCALPKSDAFALSAEVSEHSRSVSFANCTKLTVNLIPFTAGWCHPCHSE